MWYVCDGLYAVLYVRVNCFVVCGYADSRRYINACISDVCSVTNVYHNHLKFCILMVEGMSVIVNVMLSLTSLKSPPLDLCNILVHTVVRLCTFGVCFRGELGFRNCDDICMCVVNKQFELLEFVSDSVYVV